MSRFTKDSKYRLRDFERRRLFSPEDILLNSIAGQEYLPIHPFGDDADLLQDIGIKPEQCGSVDAYWNMGSDVSFLQVGTSDYHSSHEPGYYAYWPSHKQECLILTCITQSKFIVRSEFEDIMCKFLEIGCLPSEDTRRILRKSRKLELDFSLTSKSTRK